MTAMYDDDKSLADACGICRQETVQSMARVQAMGTAGRCGFDNGLLGRTSDICSGYQASPAL